jgi:hypothetical protein
MTVTAVAPDIPGELRKNDRSHNKLASKLDRKRAKHTILIVVWLRTSELQWRKSIV